MKKHWMTLLLACAGLYAQTPQESLQQLVEGNNRYVKDQLLYPNRTQARREETKKTQSPFAIILGCSDSRVAPEIVFDQGLGDLFIVRVAGNVAGPLELDSIEYSAKYLGSSLILVLGHQSCGAVSAVFDGQTEDIEQIAKLIQPAIKKSKDLENAIKANVRSVVEQLKKTALIKQLISEKKIDCVGGYYHLNSGKVEILK